jgi:hypothetical protein
MAGLQFNGDTNGLDICTLADSMVKSNSTSFTINEKTRYANMAIRNIWMDIFEAYGGWIYDDNNLTDLPVATTDLVASQRFYALPVTNMSHVVVVEFQNAGGTWIPLSPITVEKIADNGYADSEFLKTPAVPMFYRLLATGMQLYPPANFSQSQSLRIHFTRDISAFAITDTTKQPGFDPQFHEGVAIFMALKYAQANVLPVAGGVMRGGWKTGLLADWFDFEDRLKRHYSERWKQMFPPRIHVKDAVREYQ